MTRTSSKISAGDKYLQLVGAFPLRRIRSAAEHAAALKVYLRRSSERPAKDARDYLDVLADLIADYEKRTEQTVNTSGLSAAAIVRHRPDERGMTVSELARRTKISQPNLSDMLRGRRGWSKAAILAIGGLLNIRAERCLRITFDIDFFRWNGRKTMRAAIGPIRLSFLFSRIKR